MLFVNDDINDELFKKAAGDYPLKTDNPDFDQVFKKMHPDPLPSQKPQQRKRKYLLLLLLLPLFIWVMVESGHKLLNQSKENNPAQKETAALQNKNIPVTTNSTNTSIASDKTGQPSSSEQKNIPSVDAAPLVNSGNVYAQRIHKAAVQQIKISSAHAESNPVPASAATKRRIRYSRKAATAVQSIRPAATADDAFISKNDTVEKNKEETAVNPVAELQQKEIPATVAKAATKDSAASLAETKITAPPTPAVSKKQEQKNKSAKRFYAGIIAGPDLTAVKLQSVKRAGFSFGAVAGYKINNRLSIETGLLKEKKYYNTAGKYFNTGKLNLPDYIKIDYARGSCNMLELPVNVNYRFGKNTNSSWFASAGFSSYFMSKESYDYDVNYYNYIYSKSYDYTTNSTTFLAVINLGGGYTHRLGKIGELRIAPYIKIPVRKTGTGSLPLQSGGIYIGFIKNLF